MSSTDRRPHEATPAVVACDLDGTLVDEAGEPFPGIVAALGSLAAAGAHVVLCTGRTVASTQAARLLLGLPGGYAIAYHGAVLADLSDGRWLERLDLPAGAAPVLATALLRAGAAVTAYVDDERREVEWPGEQIGVTGAFDGLAVTRLVVAHVPGDLVAGLAARHRGVAVSPAPGERFELHHAGADKATALARLCARLGVTRAGAVACGDGAPDAGMLRWAGLGIAVAEGDATARAAADLVVPRAGLPAALVGLVG